MKNLSIMITGGAGFFGRHVVIELAHRGYTNVQIVRKQDYDLTNETQVRRAFQDIKPKIVIHLAAYVGGIGANKAEPGRFFFDNAMMGLLVQEHARCNGVEKFVGVGTVCEYPKRSQIPFRERHLWNGYPEETNAPYGLAKRMLLVQSQAYREQFGFNAIHVLPVNLYGPHDNFDLQTSHVIPALIRKCLEAVRTGASTIDCWGTGEVTREFLYVEDAAEGLVGAMESYDGPEPINLGTGVETRICELARQIAQLVGFTGYIRFDPTKPAGQPRRRLDTSQALKHFGFEARTTLAEGLKKTVEWCVAQEASCIQ